MCVATCVIQRGPSHNVVYCVYGLISVGSHQLRSHEHCEANYLGRLEIIHFENIVGTRSSRRRISGVDSRGSTPGGGFGDTSYLNSLRIVVGTQSVLASPLHILQPWMRSGVSAIRVFSDKSTTSARGVDNRTSSSKTRQIHRIHGIGDRGSVVKTAPRNGRVYAGIYRAESN